MMQTLGSIPKHGTHASMMELVDIMVLEAIALNGVRVRVSVEALFIHLEISPNE